MTFDQRCDAIEECYEFMLAFAAQGLAPEPGGEIRNYLRRAADALTGLAGEVPESSFRTVVERDAGDSLAAVELVLAQPRIGFQLIDNLNASIHLRALLTDLFLLDEIRKQAG